MKSKQLLAGVLAATLCLSTACGSNKDAGNDEGKSTVQSEVKDDKKPVAGGVDIKDAVQRDNMIMSHEQGISHGQYFGCPVEWLDAFKEAAKNSDLAGDTRKLSEYTKLTTEAEELKAPTDAPLMSAIAVNAFGAPTGTVLKDTTKYDLHADKTWWEAFLAERVYFGTNAEGEPLFYTPGETSLNWTADNDDEKYVRAAVHNTEDITDYFVFDDVTCYASERSDGSYVDAACSFKVTNTGYDRGYNEYNWLYGLYDANGKLFYANISGSYTTVPPSISKYVTFNGSLSRKDIEVYAKEYDLSSVSMHIMPRIASVYSEADYASVVNREDYEVTMYVGEGKPELCGWIIKNVSDHDITFSNMALDITDPVTGVTMQSSTGVRMSPDKICLKPGASAMYQSPYLTGIKKSDGTTDADGKLQYNTVYVNDALKAGTANVALYTLQFIQDAKDAPIYTYYPAEYDAANKCITLAWESTDTKEATNIASSGCYVVTAPVNNCGTSNTVKVHTYTSSNEDVAIAGFASAMADESNRMCYTKLTGAEFGDINAATIAVLPMP